MNIVAKLYGEFRPQTGGSEVTLSLRDCSTIHDALQALVVEKPEVAALLLDAKGGLNETANVFVNGLNARGLFAEKRFVQEGDVLFIVSAFGGG